MGSSLISINKNIYLLHKGTNMKPSNKKSLLAILANDTAKTFANTLTIDGMFKEEEYTFAVAHSGKDAINIARTYPPSAILLEDVILETEGEWIFSEILSIAKCPIILITPYVSADVILKFIEMGGYGCIRKTFGGDHIHDMVIRAVS